MGPVWSSSATWPGKKIIFYLLIPLSLSYLSLIIIFISLIFIFYLLSFIFILLFFFYFKLLG